MRGAFAQVFYSADAGFANAVTRVACSVVDLASPWLASSVAALFAPWCLVFVWVAFIWIDAKSCEHFLATDFFGNVG